MTTGKWFGLIIFIITLWLFSTVTAYYTARQSNIQRISYLQYEVRRLYEELERVTSQRNQCIFSCKGDGRSQRILANHVR